MNYQEEMDYTDVDNCIKDFTLQNEINDYINTGKLPDYMCNKKSFIKKIEIKNMGRSFREQCLDNNLKTFTKMDTTEDVLQLNNCIKKCDSLINEINDLQTNKMNEMNEMNDEPNYDNMCSICHEDIEEDNIVHPKCKHDLCITCFANNIIFGRNGNLCPTCRCELF